MTTTTNDDHKIATWIGSWIGSTLKMVGIVFITLKCLNVITWSWWAVLIPIWINLGFLALCLLLIGIAYLIVESQKKSKSKTTTITQTFHVPGKK